MKTLISVLAIAALSAASAFAQYMPAKEGTALHFKSTNFEDNTTEEYTANVTSVTTAPDGTVTAQLVEKHKLPGAAIGEIEETNLYTYIPADATTKLTLLTANDYKTMVVSSVKMMIESSGQYVSPQQVAEIEKALKPKGDLVLPLPAEAAEGTAFANSSIRCSFMGQSMGMKIVKGSYLGTEEIEVPAGKFQCLKLTYTLSIIGEGADTKVTSWFAPEVGLVKTTVTNKKDKPLAEDVLTSITPAL